MRAVGPGCHLPVLNFAFPGGVLLPPGARNGAVPCYSIADFVCERGWGWRWGERGRSEWKEGLHKGQGICVFLLLRLDKPWWPRLRLRVKNHIRSCEAGNRNGGRSLIS